MSDLHEKAGPSTSQHDSRANHVASLGMTSLVCIHFNLYSFWFHQMPGVAVLFEAHLLGLAVRIEAEHGRENASLDGEDVPDVERDDVGDEEVDVRGRVNRAAFANGICGAGFVGAGAETVSGFDLDAEEAAAVVEDEVVAFGVSPGLGHAEAERAGFVEEGGFGALSGALGIAKSFETRWRFGLHLGAPRVSRAEKTRAPLLRSECKSDKDGALPIILRANEKARL